MAGNRASPADNGEISHKRQAELPVVGELLPARSVRMQAQRVRDDLAAVPGIEHAVARREQLAIAWQALIVTR